MGEEISGRKKSSIDIRSLIALHVLLVAFSFGGVCTKCAAGEEFLSLPFCLFYGGLNLILGIYAVVWQQVIKKLPLTFAYANKAVGIIWSMIWGLVFFGEAVTLKKIAGAVIVIGGIVLYSLWGTNEQD